MDIITDIKAKFDLPEDMPVSTNIDKEDVKDDVNNPTSSPVDDMEAPEPELLQRGSLNNQTGMQLNWQQYYQSLTHSFLLSLSHILFHCCHLAVARQIKAPRMTFRSHTKSVLAVTVLHLPGCNPLVVSGGEDKQLVVSSLASGKEVVSLDGHVQKITAVSTAQCGGRVYLITGSWDETVRCWPVECLLGLDSDSGSPAVTPAEKEVIKKECLVLRGHRNRVYDVSVLRVCSRDQARHVVL
jgi:WD40 repeat protein